VPSPRPPSTFVISLTPFTREGALDEAALRGHLRRLAAAGIGVYVGGSGSGEGYTLSPAEVGRVLEIGAEELRGRVPVRAMGVEPRTAAQMIELGRVASAAGLDGMQVYSLDIGHGNRPRPAELERYFSDVLDAVGLDAVVSSHFAAGYFVPLDVVARLLEAEQDGVMLVIEELQETPDRDPALVAVADLVRQPSRRRHRPSCPG